MQCLARSAHEADPAQIPDLCCRTYISPKPLLQRASQLWRRTSSGQRPERTQSGEMLSLTSGTSLHRSYSPLIRQASLDSTTPAKIHLSTCKHILRTGSLQCDIRTCGVQADASMRLDGVSQPSYASSAPTCTGYRTGSYGPASSSSSAASHPSRQALPSLAAHPLP